MNKEELLEMLQMSLNDIEAQTKVIATNIETYRSPRGEKLGSNIYEARLSDGSYIMVPLLLAKAELLCAIARLS